MGRHINSSVAELESPLLLDSSQILENSRSDGKADTKNFAEPISTFEHQTIEDQIRDRAYSLYVQRGRIDGNPEKDWLDAELELLANR